METEGKDETMKGPAGYDPERIPSSVFSASQEGQGDWSGGSNDSLFSIHVGNSSFISHAGTAQPDSAGALPPLMEETNSASQSPAAAKRSKRISDSSTKSFAFPVLASDSGKNDYSVKVVPDKPPAEKGVQVEPQAEEQPQPPTLKKWFSCFSCSC